MEMEEIVNEMERFWSEALQNLKEVVENEDSAVTDAPETICRPESHRD